MISPHAALLAVAMAVAATGGWFAQGWRMDTQVQTEKTALQALRREHAESLTRATAGALHATIQWQKEKDDAIDHAQARAKIHAASAAAARTERDSLRQQLASGPQRLAGAPPSSVVEYATTVSQLLADCTGRYQELAAVADGHASDVRTLLEAWPVNLISPIDRQ